MKLIRKVKLKRIFKISLMVALFSLIPIGLVGATETPKTTEITYAQRNEFKFGQNFTLSESIQGDFYCLAKKCVVDKPIKGDVIVAAQNVEINAEIDGNIRVAAQDIILGEKTVVTRNVTIAGNTINIKKGAQIKQDLMVAGMDLDLRLILGRELLAGADNVKIFGEINGNVKLDSRRVYIDNEAVIKGNANLKAEEFDYKKQSIKGSTNEIKKDSSDRRKTEKTLTNKLKDFIVNTIAGIILALFVYVIWLKNDNHKYTNQELMINSLIGLLTPIAMMLLAIMLIVTYVTMQIGLIILLIMIVSLLLAVNFGLFAIANRLSIIPHRKKNKKTQLANFMLIVLAYHLLLQIPIINLLVMIMTFAIGNGLVLNRIFVRK